MSLVVDSVHKRFGSVVALDGVSFTVEPGRVFGLLGANGAGKTTSMRIVLDILRSESGSVTWHGAPNIDLPTGGDRPARRRSRRRCGADLRVRQRPVRHRPHRAGRASARSSAPSSVPSVA